MKVGQWIELFRAGDYGPKGEYTEDDISKMAENFEENDKVPIVIGHPKDNDPAWGWLDKMAAAGDILLARVGELHNDMFEAINYSGLFKNRSVRIADTGSGPKIMHLGMLGGTLPEVSGLAPLTFSNDDEYKDFSEDIPATEAEAGESAENLTTDTGIIETNSIAEESDEEKTIAEKTETKDEQPEKTEETPEDTGGNDNQNEGTDMSMTEEQVADLKKEAEESAAKAQAAEERAKAAEDKATKLEEKHQADMSAARRKGYEAMVKDFPNAVEEKDQPAFVEFCMAQPQGEETDFSFDDGNGTKTVDPAKWFTDFVQAKEEQIKKLKKDKPHMQPLGGDFSMDTDKSRSYGTNLAAKL